MSGFLSGLKDLVFEETTNQAPIPSNTPTPPPVLVGAKASGTWPAPPSNPQLVDVIIANALKRKTPYSSLLEIADRMKDVIPDSVMRTKAAWKTMSSDSTRSTDQVVDAIGVHINDALGEEARFKQHCNDERQKIIGPLEAQLNKLTTANEQAKSEIALLQERIQSLTQAQADNIPLIATVTTNIESAKNEIDGKEAEFSRAAKLAVTQLEQIRDAMKTTLN